MSHVIDIAKLQYGYKELKILSERDEESNERVLLVVDQVYNILIMHK